MIDSIVLTFPKGTFIADYKQFKAISKKQDNERSHYYALVQNPTRKELKDGLYKPRLTIANRINHTGLSQETLKVEFSAPKLVYGNNLDELRNDDLELVVVKLQDVLKSMGVNIFRHFIEQSQVSAIHYSKNIVLKDGTTPYHYTKLLQQANITKSLDLVRSDYRNEGHIVKYRANSYEIVFYDKIKDFKAAKISPKRAEDSECFLQPGLFESIQKEEPFEVLRFEVRLNRRQKLRSVFKKIGIDKELTLKELFDEGISQRVLKYYLEEIENYRPVLLKYKMKSIQECLADIVTNNPSMKPAKVLQMLGLKIAIEQYDMRELRQIFNKYSDRTWYRLVSDAKNIELPIQKDEFEVVRSRLSEYKPLKLKTYQSKMISNDKYG